MSKIPLHYSLKVAHKVVNKVNVPSEIAKDCFVESWFNCREQGLCISVCIGGNIDKWKKILVAQQRCSDNILVVCGQANEFDHGTNQPSEELWESEGARTEFDYDKVNEAAKFIEKCIKYA